MTVFYVLYSVRCADSDGVVILYSWLVKFSQCVIYQKCNPYLMCSACLCLTAGPAQRSFLGHLLGPSKFLFSSVQPLWTLISLFLPFLMCWAYICVSKLFITFLFLFFLICFISLIFFFPHSTCCNFMCASMVISLWFSPNRLQSHPSPICYIAVSILPQFSPTPGRAKLLSCPTYSHK